MEQEHEDFQKWIDEGNAAIIHGTVYIEQTTQWRKKFTRKELHEFFLREYIEDETRQ